MTNLCLYFQVHQPYRLLDYNFFNIGRNHFYENSALNNAVLNNVADKCYIKANKVVKKLIEKHKGRFKVAFSLSGTVLEQLEKGRPDVLASFQDLVKTGCVEILSETYYHSLSFVYSKEEFEAQVEKHKNLIGSLFGVVPTAFRNSELIYSDDIAQWAEQNGYKAILCEGVERVLKGRSPYHLYHTPHTKHIKCLLRDYKLSDDISFRYSDKNWKGYPLTPAKFAAAVAKTAEKAEVINLFMDYETFGEHQTEENGIFNFLGQFPDEILKNEGFAFKTPSELADELPAADIYHCEDYISWADTERDLSAWLSNSMQYEALSKIYALRKEVIVSQNPDLIDVWSKLQTSDHFYYMCTKQLSDGDVHRYFSPYNSPYDAYIYYMNIISDFEISLKKHLKAKIS